MATQSIAEPFLLSGTRRLLWARVFSFPVLLAVLIVAGGYIRARTNPTDPDTWWHIAVGEQILTQRAFPVADSFSFTANGTAWIAYEWLGEVAMAAASRVGGPEGRAALLFFFSGLFLMLLYYLAALRCGNPKAAFLACIGLLPLIGLFFTLRPQLMGFLLLLVTLILLKRFRQGRQRQLWILPAVFLVWVNTHGSFAFGLFFFGMYFLAGLSNFHWRGIFAETWTPEQRRHLEIVFLLCLVALTVTPYGSRAATYPVEMALYQSVNVASIQEWQPLGTDLLMGKIVVAVLAVFFLLSHLVRPTYRLEELGMLLFAVCAAALHRRFIMLLIVVLAPLLATLLARWVPPYQRAKDKPVLNLLLTVVIVVVLVAFFPAEAELTAQVARSYPVHAVEYLRQNPIPGHILNEYGWGGYLIWGVTGGHKVFIDGRADIYDYSGVLRDYMDLTHLKPGGLRVLDKYSVRACLLRKADPLATVMSRLPGWYSVYEDDLAIIFVRQGPQVAPHTPLSSSALGITERLTF